jgi:hypothetical protein
LFVAYFLFFRKYWVVQNFFACKKSNCTKELSKRINTSEEELTMAERRYTRFKMVEKCFVDYENGSSEVTLQDISLKGAMVSFNNAIPFSLGDGICLSFPLGHSDKYLQLNAEIKHSDGTMAGMEFLDTDLGTLVELHSLLKANTDSIEEINRDFSLLTGA